MIEITLTTEQHLRGARVGFARQENAVQRGLKLRYPQQPWWSVWTGHIEGACAELAVSIALELPWTGEEYLVGVHGSKPPDVGEAIDVKWCSKPERPLLNVSPKDDLEGWFVLTTGYAPTFHIHGFIHGSKAQADEWLTTYEHGSVWRIPAHRLLEFEWLKAA